MILGIFGAGGLGREILECVKQIQKLNTRWNHILFIDDVKKEHEISGVKILKYDEFKKNYTSNDARIFIGLGDPASREKIWNLVTNDGYELETIINPNVWIPDNTEINSGCYIAVGAFISCNVKIGQNSLILPNATIGHDTIIGNHCVCSGQSSVAGNCTIDDMTFVGLNSVVREKVRIASGCIVSAGSAVLRDVEEKDWILSGVPARKIAKNVEKKVFRDKN